MKKVLSLLLTLVLIFSLCAVPSYAANKTYNITKDGIDDGTSKCRVISDEITIQPGANFANSKVTTTYVIDAESADDVILNNQTGKLIGTSKGSYLNISGWLSISKDKTRVLSTYTDISKNDLEAAGLTSYTAGCDKYYYLCFKPSTEIFGLLVQIKAIKKETNKTNLNNAVSEVTGENAAKYYHTDDRFNGKEISAKGFWNDMMPYLQTAQTVANSTTVDQDAVDTATQNLNDAIAKLIPITQANATALYETVNTTWCWQQGELSDTTGTPVSADNCTAITWDAYEAAWTAAKTLLDSLYVDGTAPAAERQPELDAAVSAADPHKLSTLIFTTLPTKTIKAVKQKLKH